MITFLEQLKSGKVLVSDGATGTNLLARGLPRGVSSEKWMFEKPEEIERLHADFLQAGADILLTNTFGANPLRLKEAGLEGKVVEVNLKAVEIARQAAGDAAVYVAGSIGPSGALLKPYGPLEEPQVFESFTAQAEVLSQAGVDLLVIETHFDLKEADLAVKAAQAVSSLPLVCSFSYDSGTRTMMGISPMQVVEAIASLGVDMLGINCGRSLEDNLAALKELRAATDLPLWFKPNAGKPQRDKLGNTVYDLAPAEMGAQAGVWIKAGAKVVGGCCGTSPEHLAQVAHAVKG